MIYFFADHDIKRVRAYEKGAHAPSQLFNGLWANVDALFKKLLSP